MDPIEQGTRQQRHGPVAESSQRRLHITGLYVDGAQSSHLRRVRSSGFGGRDDRGWVLAETCFCAPSCEVTQPLSCWNLQTLVVETAKLQWQVSHSYQAEQQLAPMRVFGSRSWHEAQGEVEALVSHWPQR
jgi:hypothetical protein